MNESAEQEERSYQRAVNEIAEYLLGRAADSGGPLSKDRIIQGHYVDLAKRIRNEFSNAA